MKQDVNLPQNGRSSVQPESPYIHYRALLLEYAAVPVVHASTHPEHGLAGSYRLSQACLMPPPQAWTLGPWTLQPGGDCPLSG